MKKISVLATLLAVVMFAFTGCEKEGEITKYGLNTMSLSEFRASVESPEEVDFFNSHLPIDHTDIARQAVRQHAFQKESTKPAKLRFKWGGSGCVRSFGICLIIPLPIADDKEANAQTIDLANKLIVMPSTDDNGLTSDGYLPIFEDLYVEDGKVIKAGIYKAFRDEATGTIAVAIDLQ